MKDTQDTSFIDVLKYLNDYDVVSLIDGIFGFCSILKERDIQQQNSTFSPGSGDDSQQITDSLHKYEKIALVRCSVNIYALKSIVRSNVKSLRVLQIEDCKYFMSDSDAKAGCNQTTNLRMLQELNLIWLIEQFMFPDLEIVDIKLLKEQWSDAFDFKSLIPFKKKTHAKIKVSPVINPQTVTVSEKNIAKSNLDYLAIENTYPLSKEQLKEVFKCEDNCKFLKYELSERKHIEQSLSSERMSKLVEDLVWGDVQKKETFKDKLYENMLEDVQENLAIYKKYTKYALSDGKLIVIQDVLENAISLNQLYNLIQLNCQHIRGIVFKDNEKIRPKAFSDLMTQLFLIPELDSLAFISSVLDPSSLYELQYLMISKNVKFLTLNRSYFLQDEIDELLETPKNMPKVIVNHARWVLIDVPTQKKYEFTPFAFNLQESMREESDHQLEMQRIYIYQRHYLKQVQEEILFYQGKNLSILNKRCSERILIKYWDLLIKTEDQQQTYFQQEELTQTLQEQFKQDDIHILNYSLVRKMIDLVQDREMKKLFENQLLTSKSFQHLSESFPVSVAAKIKYKKLMYLKIAYAYLNGFTRIKESNLEYIFLNESLYNQILKCDKKYYAQTMSRRGRVILSESLSGKEVDQASIDTYIKGVTPFVDLTSLVELYLTEIQCGEGGFLFLNDLMKGCSKTKIITLSWNNFNDDNLKGVDFSLVSENLEVFDICSNQAVQSISFLNGLFSKARKLKKLLLSDLVLSAEKGDTADFSLLPPTLEVIDLSFNKISNAKMLNIIFDTVPMLSQVNLLSSEIQDQTIQQTRFPRGLKDLNISYNHQVSLLTCITQLGKTEGLEIEKLQAWVLSTEQTFPKDYQAYLVPTTLKGFNKIKELDLQKNELRDSDFVNLILCNTTVLEYLHLNEVLLSTLQSVMLSNCYESLISLEISYGSVIYNYEWMAKFFENAKKLKTLKMCHSNLSNWQFDEMQINKIPISVEELNLEGNRTINSFLFLNVIFERCTKFRILSLKNCDLTNDKLNGVEFSKINPDFEEIDLSNNQKLTTFHFLNNLFQSAPNLKKIDLTQMKIGREVKTINFDFLGKEMNTFIADEEDFFTEDFQSWIMNKLKIYLNYYDFEVLHSLSEGGENINYFGIFESYNLSSAKMKKIDLDSLPIFKGLEQDGDDAKEKFEGEKKTFEHSKVEEEKKESEVNSKENTFKNSKQANYDNYANVQYFHSLFKVFDQLLSEENIPMIMEHQNVYNCLDYQFLHFCKTQKTAAIENSLEKEGITDNITNNLKNSNTQINGQLISSQPVLRELLLAGQTFIRLDFLTFILERSRESLTKIDMSDMKLTAKLVSNIKFTSLPVLSELNLSKNTYSKNRFIAFAKQLLENAPNLKKLILRDMHMKKESDFPFDSVSATLEEIDISQNKKLVLTDSLRKCISKCQCLLKLNISDIGLTSSSGEDVFYNISDTLEEFDCSLNSEYKQCTLFSIILQKCQRLRIVNISHCGIDDGMNNQISYDTISPLLRELNLSGNIIRQNYIFLCQLHNRCKEIEKLDMSNQKISETYNLTSCSIDPHSLRDFDFSENSQINNLSIIPDIISTSSHFRRLTIQNIGLFSVRVDELQLSKIAKFIEEIDISKNEFISNISSFSFLREAPNFTTFIANKSSLDNQLLAEIQIEQAFKNLKRLELSGCNNFQTFEFLNTIFLTTSKFEYLDLSATRITSKQLKKVDFNKIPPTFQTLIFNENKLVKDFSFLNDLFEATPNSFKKLSLVECELNAHKIAKWDFSKIADCFEEINLTNNPDLPSIDFLSPFFEKNPKNKLNKITLSYINSIIITVISKYKPRIILVDCPLQTVNLSFFTSELQLCHLNLVSFIHHISDPLSNLINQNSINFYAVVSPHIQEIFLIIDQF